MEKGVHQSIAQYLILHSSLSDGALLTVSKVIMPGDLKSAKVYISVFLPSDDQRLPQSFIDVLQKEAVQIQEHLNSELKAKFCPKLKFFLDETTEKILHIEKIIDGIKHVKENQ